MRYSVMHMVMMRLIRSTFLQILLMRCLRITIPMGTMWICPRRVLLSVSFFVGMVGTVLISLLQRSPCAIFRWKEAGISASVLERALVPSFKIPYFVGVLLVLLRRIVLR